MVSDDATSDRLDALEQRIAALERESVTRATFDAEVRSLESRLREMREVEEL